MRIGGFQKLSLVDFPGKVAATVFVQGCNFHCGYCHNPDLVLLANFKATLPVQEVLTFLNDRRGKIEGVVITGGEPTLQQGLAPFIAQVKEMAFAVKLDTNGSHPEVLSSLLRSHLLDYIAMDIKSSLGKYPQLTGSASDPALLKESIDLIINSGIPYQFRTTLVKEFCSPEDLDDIHRLIGKADHYVLQPFVRSQKLVDIRFDHPDQYTSAQVEALKAKYELGTRPKGREENI